MADERDKLIRKPAPAHVRAQTAQPDPDARPRALERRPPIDTAAPAFEISDFEAKTPVFGDPLQRVEYRQKRTSQQLFNLREQFDQMKSTQTSAVVTMAEVKTKAEVVAAMLEKMLENAADERRAREAREAMREVEKAKAKAESRKITLSIVVPTITALGAAIAAVIAAIAATSS
jgi:hypothetical protein